jgi:uncharacterized protein (DUF1330 family)
MAAYCLFHNREVLDAEKLRDYKERVRPLVERWGGRYAVLGGHVDLMEGNWLPRFPVMIEFPDLAHAHGWYGSTDYQDLKAQRLSAVRSSAVFIAGL